MGRYSVKERRRILAAILREETSGNQADLLQALLRRGVRTFQSTLSRDLREIGAVRVRKPSGGYRYEVPPAGGAPVAPREKLRALVRSHVSSVSGTGVLVLVKTSPGNAAGIAVLIDALEHPHILGTVAGDDTVLVVADREKHGRALVEEFRALL